MTPPWLARRLGTHHLAQVKASPRSPRPSSPWRPTVAVIGAGFSGVLTAVHLLRAANGPRVLLIERGPRFGRGAAYASASPHHLLNVRGANMSALPDAPSHFLEWLGVDHAEGDQVFVTRDRYGQYLQSLLREAAGRAGGRLVLEHDDAVAVARTSGGWSVSLAMGRRLKVDAVVLAVGNLPPPPPEDLDPALLPSPYWISDPWTWLERNAPVSGDVLLIGAGLTAMDVALAVATKTPDVTVVALSRHGLAPLAHAPPSDVPQSAGPPSGSVRAVVRQVRDSLGDDWRGAIDALRPHVHTLWRSWSLKERQQFLRHVRPWWEVSRHRLAPATQSQIVALRETGRLDLVAGRLVSLKPDQKGVLAVWRPRGGGPVARRTFAAAVNCAGPLRDVGQAADPLIQGLVATGLAKPDPCGLGLETDQTWRLVGAAGATDGLYGVGPLTRGQVYEMTAVPDIRLQAAEVANGVLRELETRSVSPFEDPSTRQAERLAEALQSYIATRSAELALEIDERSASRRMRRAWELRGQRAALEEMAAWLAAKSHDG